MDRDGLSLLFVVFDHDKDQNKKKILKRWTMIIHVGPF